MRLSQSPPNRHVLINIDKPTSLRETLPFVAHQTVDIPPPTATVNGVIDAGLPLPVEVT
jgi:hypothetical protein